MKFLFLVVVVSAVWHASTAFRGRPPSAEDWDEDSGGYPDVDSDFKEERSDEEDLKLDRHTPFPVIYSSPSRVVYAHHTFQADPLEDTSDEDYDIGEHAPGPPTYQNAKDYISNYKQDEVSKEETKLAKSIFQSNVDTSFYNNNNKHDEVSNEEYKVSNEEYKVSREEAKLSKSIFQSNVDISSLEYIPPPIIYRPHLPMRLAYMNPKPIAVVSKDFFSQTPDKRVNNLMNSHPSSPSSPAIVYNNPAPGPVVYRHPTPAPVVFSGPNSNAAIYSKPSSAQVVYKYALPSPSVKKEEEHFHLNEKIIDYDDDNKPEPMIYDSSVYSPSINSETTSFAPYISPYIYSDSLSPSNAFEDSFSLQSFNKFPVLNHISSGFDKSKKSDRMLNLYAEPKKYNIEPSHISSFEMNPVSRKYKIPQPISNVYTELEDSSEIYRDLKDSSKYSNTESKIYENPVALPNLNPVPISNVYIDSKENSEFYKNLGDSSKFDDIEYEDVDHDILDKDLGDSNKFDDIEYEDIDHDILDKDLGDSSKFDDIDYEDVDHDILDTIPVTYNEPKSDSSNNNAKDIQVKNISPTFNIYQTDMKIKSSEEISSKLPEVKTETMTVLPKVKITESNMKSSITNHSINNDAADEVIRIAKVPKKIVKQVISPSSDRLSTFSSRRSQLNSRSDYLHRISVLRASLRDSQRRRYRDRSSEERSSNIYSFRNRLRYRTRGYPETHINSRPVGRSFYRQLSRNKSSEERIYTRRGTPWGRRRQSRYDESSEEDDKSKKNGKRISSRLNSRRLPEKTTTMKPKTTTVKNKRQLSRGRSKYDRNNRNPARQSLQCFLMSLIRHNYRC